jgi:hypothetical protein
LRGLGKIEGIEWIDKEIDKRLRRLRGLMEIEGIEKDWG